MKCHKVLIYQEGAYQAEALEEELAAGGYEVSYVSEGKCGRIRTCWSYARTLGVWKS